MASGVGTVLAVSIISDLSKHILGNGHVDFRGESNYFQGLSPSNDG